MRAPTSGCAPVTENAGRRWWWPAGPWPPPAQRRKAPPNPPAAGASTAARTRCVGAPGVVPAALGPAEAHQDSDTERIEQGVYHAVDAARSGQQSLVVPVGEEPALGDERSLVTGLDGFSGAVVLLQVLGV